MKSLKSSVSIFPFFFPPSAVHRAPQSGLSLFLSSVVSAAHLLLPAAFLRPFKDNGGNCVKSELQRFLIDKMHRW